MCARFECGPRRGGGGVVLLTVTLPSESPGRLNLHAGARVISSNANALAVNIDVGIVLGRLVGQVALLDFASQTVSWEFIVGTTDPMTLGRPLHRYIRLLGRN